MPAPQPPRRSLAEAAVPSTARSDASRLMLALNAASDDLWDWDPSTNAIYFSPRYLDMLGYTSEEFPPLSNIMDQQGYTPTITTTSFPCRLNSSNNPKMRNKS